MWDDFINFLTSGWERVKLTPTPSSIPLTSQGLVRDALKASNIGYLDYDGIYKQPTKEETRESKDRLYTTGAIAPVLPLAAYGAITAPLAMATGFIGSELAGLAVDASINHFSNGLYTGTSDYIHKQMPKSFTTNYPIFSSTLSGFVDVPRLVGGAYGGFVGHNFSNLGRYVLNNVKPIGYGWRQVPYVLKSYAEPFYKKPYDFHNYRPKWVRLNDELTNARFENGANWARIPESEIPRKYFVKNPDGTFSPTYINTSSGVTDGKGMIKGLTMVDFDDITPGTIGGEHSNYTYLGQDNFGNRAMMYTDVLKINPLWKISDKIKNTFHLTEGTPVYNIVDKLGGIDLNPMLGYRPFTIKFGYTSLPSGKIQLIDLENVALH